jgi:hypothetical protein
MKRWASRENDGDAIMIVQGYSIPVHSAVVETESSHIEGALRRSFQKTGKRIYHVHSIDIHSFWRVLQLIYLFEYSGSFTDACILGIISPAY